MITCVIVIFDRMTIILFDPGSTCLYVSVYFALGVDAVCDVLDAPIHVYSLVGESAIVTHLYSFYFVPQYLLWEHFSSNGTQDNMTNVAEKLTTQHECSHINMHI